MLLFLPPVPTHRIENLIFRAPWQLAPSLSSPRCQSTRPRSPIGAFGSVCIRLLWRHSLAGADFKYRRCRGGRGWRVLVEVSVYWGNIISYHARNPEILHLNFLNFDFMVKAKSKDLYYVITTFDLVSNQFLQRLLHHCLPDEKSHLKITSNVKKLCLQYPDLSP